MRASPSLSFLVSWFPLFFWRHLCPWIVWPIYFILFFKCPFHFFVVFFQLLSFYFLICRLVICCEFIKFGWTHLLSFHYSYCFTFYNFFRGRFYPLCPFVAMLSLSIIFPPFSIFFFFFLSFYPRLCRLNYFELFDSFVVSIFSYGFFALLSFFLFFFFPLNTLLSFLINFFMSFFKNKKIYDVYFPMSFFYCTIASSFLFFLIVSTLLLFLYLDVVYVIYVVF